VKPEVSFPSPPVAQITFLSQGREVGRQHRRKSGWFITPSFPSSPLVSFGWRRPDFSPRLDITSSPRSPLPRQRVVELLKFFTFRFALPPPTKEDRSPPYLFQNDNRHFAIFLFGENTYPPPPPPCADPLNPPPSQTTFGDFWPFFAPFLVSSQRKGQCSVASPRPHGPERPHFFRFVRHRLSSRCR